MMAEFWIITDDPSEIHIEIAGEVVARLRLSEDDHGPRLIIDSPDKPKATRIIRL